MLTSKLTSSRSVPRSLLYFVIRDHIGNTPLSNLRNTLLQDLGRIWSSLSKPPGLEESKIQDYFDFAFVALPHKILQPEKFVSEVQKLGTRFREGYKDSRGNALQLDEDDSGIFLPEYHRRIPADGFSHYASGVWDQIVSNKDLDLPTQQELLAQFRCDEIAREVLVAFDEIIVPLESRQADAEKAGKPKVLPELGVALKTSRTQVIKDFETEASRYHKGVFARKREELLEKVDSRLKALFVGQLSAAHKAGVTHFTDAVTETVRLGQKKGNYDFAEIVETEKKAALGKFDGEARGVLVQNAPWSNYTNQLDLFTQDLDVVSAKLRQEEMRRLASRIERWVKTRLAEGISLEFNSIGTGRGGSGAPGDAQKPASEKDLWDRVWKGFTDTVEHAQGRFTERARGFDATPNEVEVGLWRLLRKSWAALRAKIEEEVMEGNIMLKLREKYVEVILLLDVVY